MRINCIIVVCIGFITSLPATVLYTSLSSDSLTLGDRIQFSVSVVTPPKAVVTPPATESGFGKLVVKNWGLRTINRKNFDSLVYTYLLTTYEVEQCTIPPLTYAVQSDTRYDTVRTEMIPLRVFSVIKAGDNDTIRLKDLKPQQKTGSPSLLWLWLALMALGIVAAALLLRFYLKKKNRPPPEIPRKPPYEEAMEALDALEAKGYLITGMIREYVFELSEIVKRYTGRRFESNVDDMTTEEVLSWLDTAPVSSEHRKTLESFFTATHPVKFAKIIPGTEMLALFKQQTRGFIEETKPVQAEVKKPEQKIEPKPERKPEGKGEHFDAVG